MVFWIPGRDKEGSTNMKTCKVGIEKDQHRVCYCVMHECEVCHLVY